MAGKGAPKGNQYARKAERERGISLSYYLDAYEYEFLQKAVEYDGNEPTVEEVRKKAKSLLKKAISQEAARVFDRYRQERSSEEE